MENKEFPITLDEQVVMMKKYVCFRQHKKMRRFIEYTGYYRASRYGKFLLSCTEEIGKKPKQDTLFSLYQFDVKLRRLLNYYCNRVEVRFKSAVSNACSIHTKNSMFYLDEQYYTTTKAERDAKIRKYNISYFHNIFFKDIIKREEKLRKDVMKYPELKEYRKGGSKSYNKLPIWVSFHYFEFGTVTMMYSYLRGELRKKVLTYMFQKKRYTKKETEIVDTWLDAIRNLRNYCAHNSMLIGMKSSVVLREPIDDISVLQKDNDLFSRIYALKKLLSIEDAEDLKKDIKKLIKRTPLDIYLLHVLPENWEEMYNKINVF